MNKYRTSFLRHLLLLCCTSACSGTLEWHLVDKGTGIPAPLPRRDAAIGYDQTRNRLIIFGGMAVHSEANVILGDTLIYNVDAGDWSLQNTKLSPEPRFSMVYGTSGNYFYVATGEGKNMQYYNDIWRFDFRRNSWEKLPMQDKPAHYSKAQWQVRDESSLGPEPRHAAAGGIFMNASRFYVSYGFSDVDHSDTLSYSIPELSWFIDSVDKGPYHPNYPHGRYLHAGTMISEDELFIFGGCLSGGGTGGACPSADSWIFNGKTKTWRNTGSCASPRTKAATSLLPISDGERRVLVFGGQEQGPGRQVLTTIASPKDQVAVLNPDTGVWALRKTSGNVPSKRSSVSLVTGRNGVYLFGGFETETGSLKNDLYLLLGRADEADRAPLQAECNPTFFNLILLHGVLMALAWGFFLPWGAFIARYLRHNDPLWFNLHKLFQIFGLFMAIGGFICAVLSVQSGHFKFVHGIVGLATMIIGILQPFNALIRPEVAKDTERKSIRRFCWEVVHAFLGRCGIGLGLANVSLGVFLAHSHIIVWSLWFGYLGFFFLTHFVAEITYSRRQMRDRGEQEAGAQSEPMEQYVVKNIVPATHLPPSVLDSLDPEREIEPL